jgi:hypothetical protein
MKTQSRKARFLFATAALGALASSSCSSPGPQYWHIAKPVTTFSDAKSVSPNDTVTMQCKGCKTVMIREVRHVGPLGKGHDFWATVGSKHTCGECKGEITVVNGRTTDSMQHNCSKCGEAGVTCCVATAVEKKK